MRKAKGQKVQADARFAELAASADMLIVVINLEKDNMRFNKDRKVTIVNDFFVLPVDVSSQSTQLGGDANVCAGNKAKGACYYLEEDEMVGLLCVLDSDPARRALKDSSTVKSRQSIVIVLLEEVYAVTNKKKVLVAALIKKQVDAAVAPLNKVVPTVSYASRDLCCPCPHLRLSGLVL